MATALGDQPVVHEGWIAVDAKTSRVATCIVVTALPEVIARCKRVVPAWLKATPPDKLPD